MPTGLAVRKVPIVTAVVRSTFGLRGGSHFSASHRPQSRFRTLPPERHPPSEGSAETSEKAAAEKSCSIGARERPRRRRGRRAAGSAANRSSRCAPSCSKPLQWGLLRLLPHTSTARVIGPPEPSLLTWTVHLRVCSQSSVATHKSHFRVRHFGTTFTSWYNFPAPAAGSGNMIRRDSGSYPGRAESQLTSELGELPLLGPQRLR